MTIIIALFMTAAALVILTRVANVLLRRVFE